MGREEWGGMRERGGRRERSVEGERGRSGEGGQRERWLERGRDTYNHLVVDTSVICLFICLVIHFSFTVLML